MTRRRRALSMRLSLATCTAILLTIGTACGGSEAGQTTQDPPASPDEAVALQSMAAFNTAFYRGTQRQGVYMKDTNGGRYADFWTTAEMIETAEDYYDYTGRADAKDLVLALLDGFTAHYGTDWMSKYKGGDTGANLGPRANDDIMWICIATARAYHITGDDAYRQMAAANFEAVYTRSWSKDMGGGVWWRVLSTGPFVPQKNTTTNGPAVIAACELYNDVHQPLYLAQARSVYGWLRANLYDPATGRVYDNISLAPGGGTRIDTTEYSYNQGTFIGAATMLYAVTGDPGYATDARRAIDYTRAHLTTTGSILLPGSKTPDRDAGGFNGIFARWALRFTRDSRITDYDTWFRANADAAWSHRNTGGLMGADWTKQTGTGPLYAWDCSSGVAMQEVLLPLPAGLAP